MSQSLLCSSSSSHYIVNFRTRDLIRSGLKLGVQTEKIDTLNLYNKVERFGVNKVYTVPFLSLLTEYLTVLISYYVTYTSPIGS